MNKQELWGRLDKALSSEDIYSDIYKLRDEIAIEYSRTETIIAHFTHDEMILAMDDNKHNPERVRLLFAEIDKTMMKDKINSDYVKLTVEMEGEDE